MKVIVTNINIKKNILTLLTCYIIYIICLNNSIEVIYTYPLLS
jgi:hypothetical protein